MASNKVVLYYPNNWRRNIGKLASENDKKFNWFLCSKKYKDPASGLYVVEIGNGTKFYEENTGKTLVAPLTGKIILLLDAKIDDIRVKKFGYQGVAKLVKCKMTCKASDEFIVCKEASFEFLEGVLVRTSKETLCPIIEFSKRNISCIKKVIPDFPNEREIDEALKNTSCNVVCKVLYSYISEYVSKI
jgi:hypothetical protein